MRHHKTNQSFFVLFRSAICLFYGRHLYTCLMGADARQVFWCGFVKCLPLWWTHASQHPTTYGQPSYPVTTQYDKGMLRCSSGWKNRFCISPERSRIFEVNTRFVHVLWSIGFGHTAESEWKGGLLLAGKCYHWVFMMLLLASILNVYPQLMFLRI